MRRSRAKHVGQTLQISAAFSDFKPAHDTANQGKTLDAAHLAKITGFDLYPGHGGGPVTAFYIDDIQVTNSATGLLTRPTPLDWQVRRQIGGDNCLNVPPVVRLCRSASPGFPPVSGVPVAIGTKGPRGNQLAAGAVGLGGRSHARRTTRSGPDQAAGPL